MTDRLHAAMMLAADSTAWEALAAGEAVPAHRLSAAVVERLGLSGDVVLDDALARQVELLGPGRDGGTDQRPAFPGLSVVTLDDFVSVDEPGADPILGTPDDVVIAENGDVMVYGDGGTGKTTLMVDLACHLAAGDDWLGITVPRPVRVLLIENEGPRALFREKLRRKRDGWTASPLGDRILVMEAPWAQLSLAKDDWREVLADTIRDLAIDVLIVGPLSRIGMNEAGTLHDVAEFMALIADVRRRAERRCAVILVHHENKGGKVSGAWEGSGDTLLHVSGEGKGRTRLYVQKARWASSQHGQILHLTWTDGEGFEVEEKPELDDETIADNLLAFIGMNPGTGWTKALKENRGASDTKLRAIRDGLFAAGRILNVVKKGGIETALSACPERQQARLYLADDPTVRHLRPQPDADGTQPASPPGAGDQLHLRRASVPKETHDVDAAADAPDKTREEDAG